MHAPSLAFNRPETDCRPAIRSRPIDLDHLAAQTMGQKDLETEVLSLFVKQVRQCMRDIANAPAYQRPAFAHSLKGSARGVGAFSLADCAERLETAPDSKAAQDDLIAAVVDVENFLSKLSR